MGGYTYIGFSFPNFKKMEYEENKNKRKEGLLVIAIAVVALVVLIGFSYHELTGNFVGDQRITISYLGGVNNLPLYVALEKGYFDDAGIEVNIVKLDSPNLIVDYVLSGRAEFAAPGGPVGIAALAHHQSPGELKVYNLAAESKERVGTSFVVRKDSLIESVSDLEGKTIGNVPGIQWKIMGKHILNQEGLKKTRIVELPLGSQIQALVSGQIDAILTIEPIGTIAVEKGLARHLVKAPIATYVSNPWFGGAGIVDADFAEDNPELAEKVIDIFNKAAEEVNQFPDENRKYLPKYTPLNEALSEKVPILFFRDTKNLNTKELEDLKAFLDLFTEYGAIKGTIDVESLLY